MRKVVFVGVLSLATIYIILRIAEVQQIADTFQKGDLRFIGLAILVAFIWMVGTAFQYWVVFRELGVTERLEHLIPVTSAAFFVNVIAPSVGMSGLAVFAGEARKRGYSPARATTASILVLLFDYLAFFCFLVLGLLVLFRHNNLTTLDIGASIFLLFSTSVLGYLLAVGMRSAESLGNALAWMTRKVNRILRPFIHREYLSEQRAYHFAQDTSDALNELRRKPKNLILPVLLAITNKAFLVVILFLMFLAFNIPTSVEVLIGGFSIGYLFLIVSPTPAGLGFVEGGLTLALTTLNVPIGAAAVITLAYRGVTFWLPLLVGLISFRYILNKEGMINAEIG
jgi:glycosyltransferase 2 family protein